MLACQVPNQSNRSMHSRNTQTSYNSILVFFSNSSIRESDVQINLKSDWTEVSKGR